MTKEEHFPKFVPDQKEADEKKKEFFLFLDKIWELGRKIAKEMGFIDIDDYVRELIGLCFDEENIIESELQAALKNVEREKLGIKDEVIVLYDTIKQARNLIIEIDKFNEKNN